MRLRCTFFGVYAKKENDRKNGGIHDVISGKFRLGRGNRSLSDRGRSAGALEVKSDNVPPLFRRYVFVGKEVRL